MPAAEHVAFVRNVAAGVTLEQLQGLFEGCGGIKGVRLPLDWNTGQPRVGVVILLMRCQLVLLMSTYPWYTLCATGLCVC